MIWVAFVIVALGFLADCPAWLRAVLGLLLLALVVLQLITTDRLPLQCP